MYRKKISQFSYNMHNHSLNWHLIIREVFHMLFQEPISLFYLHQKRENFVLFLNHQIKILSCIFQKKSGKEGVLLGGWDLELFIYRRETNQRFLNQNLLATFFGFIFCCCFKAPKYKLLFSPSNSLSFKRSSIFFLRMAKVRGLAPGPDLTQRPVNARGARLRGSSPVLTLNGEESK